MQWRRDREVTVQILLVLVSFFFFLFLFCLFVVVVVAFFPFDLRVDMAAEMLEQWGHVREVCGSIPR